MNLRTGAGGGGGNPHKPTEKHLGVQLLHRTFCQMSSNCSTPSATLFRHLSISPGLEEERTVDGMGGE